MGLGMEISVDDKIVSYLDYVKKNALKYVGYGVSYDDLVQISCIALINAVNNYKHTRNFKEYLNIYIHHYLNEAIVKANCIQYTDSSYYVDIFKILKAHKGGCVSFQEIHEKTSLSIDRIKECYHFIKKDISLNEHELCDVESLELEIINNFDDSMIIDKIFSNTYITKKEKLALKLRYGFYGKLYTVYEISRILNVSHQRVSILIKNAIKKIRYFLLSIGIVSEYDFELKKDKKEEKRRNI